MSWLITHKWLISIFDTIFVEIRTKCYKLKSTSELRHLTLIIYSIKILILRFAKKNPI